jgi:hypothetical protein
MSLCGTSPAFCMSHPYFSSSFTGGRPAGGQVLGVPADKAHALAVLVGEHAVAVDLFLVDPAVVMEGLRHQGWVHGGDAGGIRSSVARRAIDGG